MSKLITVPFIVAFTASSVVAGMLVFLTSVAPLASAEPRLAAAEASVSVEASDPKAVQAVVSQPEAQRTVAAGSTGSACSVRSWPNYDQGCQFDRRPSGDAVRTVRVVDLEIRAIAAQRQANATLASQ